MNIFTSNGRHTPRLPQASRGLAVAFFLLCGSAHSAEFSVPFKPLKHDVLATEIVWQAANVVDLQQTLRGGERGYRETGTLSLFAGSHPSRGEAWAGMLAFGLAHYAVTQGLANLGWDRAERAWAYFSLGVKVEAVRRNEREGLGL